MREQLGHMKMKQLQKQKERVTTSAGCWRHDMGTTFNIDGTGYESWYRSVDSTKDHTHVLSALDLRDSR